jgi:cytochrome c biogenesis protein
MTLTDPRRNPASASGAGRGTDPNDPNDSNDDGATRLSTAPDPDSGRRITGDDVVSVLRRSWRQLTSMRTALLLLFLLALAAVPGSILPQHRLNELKVDAYYRAHPTLAPLLDKIGLFGVFSAPWFAAIYLLLFVSLIGCLIPRIRLHARAMARRPPAAPRYLDRLPHTASYETAGSPAEVAPAVRRLLRGWRTVVRDEGDGAVAVSAERGYLRETGNLVFHVALLVLLAGIAMGALWGWKATRLVVEGETFCNSVSQYDEYTSGRLVRPGDIPPFCVALDRFTATYQPTGEPKSFDAKIRYGGLSGDLNARYDVSVNHPLRHLSTRTYLIDHGFAPVITVTDPSGQTFRQPWPFLPQNTSTYVSDGVVKLADAKPKQIGIQGVFTPTRDPSDRFGLTSLFPAPRNPALSMVVYEGDLGLDSGVPQSVYSLDQTQIQRGKLKVVGRKLLLPGQSFRLSDGTTIRFDGFKEWATFQVSHDPGELVVLIAAVFMVLGLLGSLRVRRRRVWARIAPAGEGESAERTVVSLGGLARTDADSFAEEFNRIAAAARAGATASPEHAAGAVDARRD